MIDPSAIKNKYPKQQAESITVEQTSTIDAMVHELYVTPGDLCQILSTIPEDANISCINIEIPKIPGEKTFSTVKIDFSIITTHENKPASSVTIRGMDTKE